MLTDEELEATEMKRKHMNHIPDIIGDYNWARVNGGPGCGMLRKHREQREHRRLSSRHDE